MSVNSMDEALQRCYRAVPLTHVRDMAPRRGVLALRCSRTGCIACADFETDGRPAFEDRLYADEAHLVIRKWNCNLPEMRELAFAAGVTDIPAYILVRSTGEVIVRPVS